MEKVGMGDGDDDAATHHRHGAYAIRDDIEGSKGVYVMGSCKKGVCSKKKNLEGELL
ncbi:uncharacterized protein DS421_13g411390 [Arachis hypogaea]|nr:uncharacterized protein DS421_13g411390 [Arachis hypogaea]